MGLLIVVAALVLLDLAALRWGVDSRAGARGHGNTGGILPQTGDDGVRRGPATKEGEMINLFDLEQRAEWHADEAERWLTKQALLREARASHRPAFRARLARSLVTLARRLDPAVAAPRRHGRTAEATAV